jgi:hypothetical protein
LQDGDQFTGPESALSPKRKRHQAAEPVRKHSNAGCAKPEADIAAGTRINVARRESDVLSGRGSISLRSLQSGISAGDSEEGRDNAVRAFITGSGRAVRKFAQRLLNYVGSSPENSRAGQSDSRGMSSSSSSGALPSDHNGSASQGMSVHSSRLARRPADAPRTSSSPPKNHPRQGGGPVAVNAEHLRSHVQDGEPEQGHRGGEGQGGVVFNDLGVGGWETTMPEPMSGVAPKLGAVRDGTRAMRAIPKRGRARDLADAEYDHGKPKKVKRARPGQGITRVSTGGINPFQAAAERRRHHGVC